MDSETSTALLERVLVVVVLLDGTLVDGLAEFGGTGNAIAEGLAGATDDDVAELGHDDPPFVYQGLLPFRCLHATSVFLVCILYTI